MCVRGRARCVGVGVGVGVVRLKLVVTYGFGAGWYCVSAETFIRATAQLLYELAYNLDCFA